MELKQITDVISVVKKLNFPVCHPEDISFYRWNEHCVNEDECIKTLSSSLNILLPLAETVFYSQTLGGDDLGCCHAIYLSLEEFDLKSAYIWALFKEKSAYKIDFKSKADLWYVQVQGVSDFGKIIFNKMQKQLILPEELLKLYFSQKIALDFKRQAVFEVLKDNSFTPASESDFCRSLCREKWIRTIDVTSMTLDTLLSSKLLSSLVNNKEKVYLFINEYKLKSGTKTYVKFICWY